MTPFYIDANNVLAVLAHIREKKTWKKRISALLDSD